MPDPVENIPHDDREEQKWIQATKNIFNAAMKQQPPQISRSEVESLIIGLRSNVVTKRGAEVLSMLEGYLKLMKDKKKSFVKITTTPKA